MAGLHALAGANRTPSIPSSPMQAAPSHTPPAVHRSPIPMDDQDFLCREEGPEEEISDDSPPAAGPRNGLRNQVFPAYAHPQLDSHEMAPVPVHQSGLRSQTYPSYGSPRMEQEQLQRQDLQHDVRRHQNLQMQPSSRRLPQEDQPEIRRVEQPAGRAPSVQPLSSSQSGSSFKGPIQPRPAIWQRVAQAQDLPERSQAPRVQPPLPRARLHPEDRHRVARKIEDHEVLAAQASQAARAVQAREQRTTSADQEPRQTPSSARAG